MEPVERPNCVFDGTRYQQERPADYLYRYSNLVRKGRKKELVRAMALVASGVVDVEILTDENREPYLSFATLDGNLRPVHDLGSGAVRLVRLLLGVSAAKNGIFCSDVIENGIHHGVRRKVWASTRKWMDQWNVQVVATTHSAGMIDAAIDAFENNPSDLAIHQLFRNDKQGRIEATTFTGDALAGVRDLNLEVR